MGLLFNIETCYERNGPKSRLFAGSCHHHSTTMSAHIRDETILQYIDILQYLLLQYNIIWLKGDIDILHIAIYCIVCYLNVVNTQSLHHKNDQTSKNLDYTPHAFIWSYRV